MQGREWGKGKIGVTSEAEDWKKEASGDMILILLEYTQREPSFNEKEGWL